MNARQLANKLQMASLPEADYGLRLPDGLVLDVAYPEVRVGLHLSERGGVHERAHDGWLVVEAGQHTLDLQGALGRLQALYEDRLAQLGHAWEGTPAGNRLPLLGASGDHVTPQEPGVDRPAPADACATPDALPAGSADLEAVLRDYLGLHLLSALRGRGQTDLRSWWREAALSPDFLRRLERADRLLRSGSERSGE